MTLERIQSVGLLQRKPLYLVDALWVSETSVDPPQFEGGGINNAKDLATEALYINQNFRRQVLKRGEEPFKYENERAPFEEDKEEYRAECAYRLV